MMARASEIAALRDLQGLHEQRNEADFAAANLTRRKAEESHAQSSALLDQAVDELDRTVGGSELKLGNLLLLSSHISHLERATTIKRATVSDAQDAEDAARTTWQRAQRRGEMLDEQSALQARGERRKADEKSDREALARHNLRGKDLP